MNENKCGILLDHRGGALVHEAREALAGRPSVMGPVTARIYLGQQALRLQHYSETHLSDVASIEPDNLPGDVEPIAVITENEEV